MAVKTDDRPDPQPEDGPSLPAQEMVFDDAFGYWVPVPVREQPADTDRPTPEADQPQRGSE